MCSQNCLECVEEIKNAHNIKNMRGGVEGLRYILRYFLYCL